MKIIHLSYLITFQNGNTPLHAAAKQNPDDIELHSFLVERGGDPYMPNKVLNLVWH